MSKRIFELKLDLFPGFYESILMNSDTAYWAIKNEYEYLSSDCGREDIKEEDLDFDYEGYRKDVVEAFVEVYKNYSPDIVESLEYSRMWSPKYYNFATDEIYCTYKLSANWVSVVRKFMKENYEWLKDRIKNDWTSYDGFDSFMSNDIEEWYDKVFKEYDKRYIGCLITYMMFREYLNEKGENKCSDGLVLDICMETLEDIFEGAYVYNVNEKEVGA